MTNSFQKNPLKPETNIKRESQKILNKNFLLPNFIYLEVNIAKNLKPKPTGLYNI